MTTRAPARPIISAFDIAALVTFFGAWFVACRVPASTAIIQGHRSANAIACAHSKLDLARTIEAALSRKCVFVPPATAPETHVWLLIGIAFAVSLIALWIGGVFGYARGRFLGPRVRLGAFVGASVIAALLVVVRHRAVASSSNQAAVDAHLGALCETVQKERIEIEQRADDQCRKLGLHLAECFERYPTAKAEYERYRKLQFEAALAKAEIDAGEFSCAEPPKDLVETVQFGLSFGRSESTSGPETEGTRDAGVDAPTAPDDGNSSNGTPGGGHAPPDAGTADAGVNMPGCDDQHCLAPATCHGDTCVPPAPGTLNDRHAGLRLEDLLIFGAFGFPGLITKLLLAGGPHDQTHTEAQGSQQVDNAEIARQNPKDPRVAPLIAEGARRTGQLREAQPLIDGTPAGETLKRQIHCIDALSAFSAEKKTALCSAGSVSELTTQLLFASDCKLDYGAPIGRYVLAWVVRCRCAGGKLPPVVTEKIPTDDIACEVTP